MAMVEPVFFDTTVLLAGSIDFGESSTDAQRSLDAVTNGDIADARTAWHCCLEFYAVSTRLPPGYRLSPAQACRLLQEIVCYLRVEQLPPKGFASFFDEAVREKVAGGRIYDAHVAEIARHSGASVVVTDNRRHFAALLKDGIRVLRPSEFLAALPNR